MPKVIKDPELVTKTRALVAQLGSLTLTAHHVGMDKTTLWRFLKNGRAIERNRELLRSAVDSRQNATVRGRRDENATTSETKNVCLLPQDLQRIRAMCQSMMAMIDMYETWSKDVVQNRRSEAR